MDDSDMGRVSFSKRDSMKALSASFDVPLCKDKAPTPKRTRRAVSVACDHSMRYVQSYVTADNRQGRRRLLGRDGVSGEDEGQLRKKLDDWGKGEPISKEDSTFLFSQLRPHFMFKALSDSALQVAKRGTPFMHAVGGVC